MTTQYDQENAADSRQSVTVVKLFLDRCGEVNGVLPCTATGEPCYNTYRTCKDIANYNRVTDQPIVISTADADIPFPGVRPYLGTVNISAAEIKLDRTATGRLTFEVFDEPDTDVGVDPYIATRVDPPTPSYWGALKARNPNYLGRFVEVWQGYIDPAAGFAGSDPLDLQFRWFGTLSRFAQTNSGWQFEAVDPLKSLDNIEVPLPADVTLAAPILAFDLAATVTNNVDLLDAPNYIKIGTEIIEYSAIDRISGVLTFPVAGRGIDGTDAADHAAGADVGRVKKYQGNPWDLMQEVMLVDAEYPPAVVDSAAFDTWRDFGTGEPTYTRYITEATTLTEILYSLSSILNAWIWYDEGQKITTRRNIANQPGREYLSWSDPANVVDGKIAVDDNVESQKAVAVVFWDLAPLGDPSKKADYNRKTISIDGEAVSENLFKDTTTTTNVFLPWVTLRDLEEGVAARHASTIGGRLVMGGRYPLSILRFELEQKDGGVRTGDLVRMDTDAILDPSGHPVVQAAFAVMRRETKETNVSVKVMQMPSGRVAFFAPSGLPSYEDATPAQREYGFWAADGRLPNGDDAYGYW